MSIDRGETKLQSLDSLNQKIADAIEHLQKVPAEELEADELVSNLLDLVTRRQLLLDDALKSPKDEDKSFLETQLALTNQFTQAAVSLLKHRQELLHMGNKSQRQLNVYKSIDSNR
ncbi:hypothetical protein [Shewanella psychrotolerans]|uniref:hypothetical protein n=1 Tax=Shewanella psychrotolerans TaxID=2864206 RepID=UPI0021AC90A0|nr:hypothetical protein [Shewanella psychrotolerans]